METVVFGNRNKDFFKLGITKFDSYWKQCIKQNGASWYQTMVTVLHILDKIRKIRNYFFMNLIFCVQDLANTNTRRLFQFLDIGTPNQGIRIRSFCINCSAEQLDIDNMIRLGVVQDYINRPH